MADESEDYIENRTFDEIQTGQVAELQRTLTRDDIALFGRVSGDFNPAQMDADFAREHGAKGVVGHSLWATSLIAGLLANVLPGPVPCIAARVPPSITRWISGIR